MSAGRGDFQRAPGGGLAADLRHVRAMKVFFGLRQAKRRRGVRRDLHFAAQKTNHLLQALHGNDGDSLDDGGLVGVGLGHQQAAHPFALGAQRQRQRAAYRAQLAVEPQLADQGVVPQLIAGDRAACGQHPHRQRQVEGHPFLADIGRRHVGGDPPAGEPEAGVADRRPHPLAAFLDRPLGQADDLKNRWKLFVLADRDIDLKGHLVSINAINAEGKNFCESSGHNPTQARRITWMRLPSP